VLGERENSFRNAGARSGLALHTGVGRMNSPEPPRGLACCAHPRSHALGEAQAQRRLGVIDRPPRPGGKAEEHFGRSQICERHPLAAGLDVT